VGDDVLRAFAKVVTAELRSTDRVARYGGEEFLLLLCNTSEAHAALLAAERLRSTVAAHPWSELAADLAVTCSIGLTMSRAGEGVAEMLARADAALYRAKSDGRNAVNLG
jgi:diguanylate cyclase (GGDEF)-like protein